MKATLANGAVGFLLMILFEGPFVRWVGMLTLLAFIVCGVGVIANREYLERSGEDEAP